MTGYDSGKDNRSICLGYRNLLPLPGHFSSYLQKGRTARAFRVAAVSQQKESRQEMPACHTRHSLVLPAVFCSGTRIPDPHLAAQDRHNLPDNRLSDDSQQRDADLPGPVLPHGQEQDPPDERSDPGPSGGTVLYRSDHSVLHPVRQVAVSPSDRTWSLCSGADAGIQGQHSRICGRGTAHAEQYDPHRRLDPDAGRKRQRNSHGNHLEHRQGTQLGQHNQHDSAIHSDHLDLHKLEGDDGKRRTPCGQKNLSGCLQH